MAIDDHCKPMTETLQKMHEPVCLGNWAKVGTMRISMGSWLKMLKQGKDCYPCEWTG
jgi:hypothetical protein